MYTRAFIREAEKIRDNRLRWNRHVGRKKNDDIVKKVRVIEVKGVKLS